MSWKGVKKHIDKENIKIWCDKMRIRDYTINNKGEINVDANVFLESNTFSELPYKFRIVNGSFILYGCKNLTSLKNCPDRVYGDFDCSKCIKLNSLDDCPKVVVSNFSCEYCNRKFTEEEVRSLCEVSKEVLT